MAFRQIDDVRQEPGHERSWFRDGDIDLLVDHSGTSPERLSLSYPWQNQQLQLFSAGEQRHNHVLDDGESRPGRMKATPIAATEAPVPGNWLRQFFHDDDGLPRWLSQHVQALLKDY